MCFDRNWPVVEEQLKKAGLRPAGMLKVSARATPCPWRVSRGRGDRARGSMREEDQAAAGLGGEDWRANRFLHSRGISSSTRAAGCVWMRVGTSRR